MAQVKGWPVGERVEIFHVDHAGRMGVVVGAALPYGGFVLQAVRVLGTQDVLLLVPSVEFGWPL